MSLSGTTIISVGAGADQISSTNAQANSIWPLDFLAEIKRRNQKTPNMPVALILTSAQDWNGSLTAPASRFLFLTLAKTHRVVLQTIQNKKDIPNELHQ